MAWIRPLEPSTPTTDSADAEVVAEGTRYYVKRNFAVRRVEYIETDPVDGEINEGPFSVPLQVNEYTVGKLVEATDEEIIADWYFPMP